MGPHPGTSLTRPNLPTPRQAPWRKRGAPKITGTPVHPIPGDATVPAPALGRGKVGPGGAARPCPRRPSASARRPLGNPCRGEGQKHVWVCGRSCGRNVQVPGFQHLRRGRGINWKQSICCRDPGGKGGARAPSSHPPETPAPLPGGSTSPIGMSKRVTCGAGRGHRVRGAVRPTGCAGECPKPPRAGALLTLVEGQSGGSCHCLLPPPGKPGPPLQPAWLGTRD